MHFAKLFQNCPRMDTLELIYNRIYKQKINIQVKGYLQCFKWLLIVVLFFQILHRIGNWEHLTTGIVFLCRHTSSKVSKKLYNFSI